MKITRIIFMSAVILIIFQLFTACANDDGEIKTTSENSSSTGNEEDNEETAAEPPQRPALDLPDEKYGGYKFRIINSPSDEMRANTTIFTEEETGEGVNDAVYKRNRLVEERFDIEVTEIKAGRWDITAQATKSIRAELDEYDLIMYSLDEGPGIAQNKMAVAYNDIPYVDLTQSWWDRDMVRDLSIGGKNYFVTGAFSLIHNDKTQGMFFNKKLHQELELESLYLLVESGKWTFDKFNEMVKDITKDLDGDGLFTEKDRYGLITWPWVYGNAFMASAGQQMVGKDADDMHLFNADNEKFINVFQKLMGIMHEGNMLFNEQGNYTADYLQMFINDQTLFYCTNLYMAVGMRGMETDFGIIPIPKYDENQGRYYSYVYPPPVMIVPVTTQDLNRTGMVLEALCYESTDTVVKAYYDDLLKTKITRDDESEGMLDVIFGNRIYSVTDIYYMSETYESFYNLCDKKDANIVSWIEQRKDRIQSAIDKNNEMFGSN